MVLQKILVLENLILLISTQIGSLLLQLGFGKLLFRVAIFNIKLSFSSTFMKDKIMLKSVLCDLTPLDLCISGCHPPFSPWSISSSAEVVLTVQSLHFTGCVSKSCVPIILLSHQKTAGHPSPAGELLLSQSLPRSLFGNPAVPLGGSSSVTLLSGADWRSCVVCQPAGSLCFGVCWNWSP